MGLGCYWSEQGGIVDVKPGGSVAQLVKQDAVEKGTTPAYLQASSNFQTSGWNSGLDHD